MKIKHYTADSLQEAMLKVKNDLGRDAIILHTRRFKHGGFLGLFGKDLFEVTATIEAKVPSLETAPKREIAGRVENNRVSALEAEISQLRHAVEAALLSQRVPLETASCKLKDLLLKNDVDSLVADNLLHDILRKFPEEKDLPAARNLLQQKISQCVLRVEGIKLSGDKPKKVALLGPTGVGKTTTIAKLAANFSLIEEKKVALITADTYRIAAVEQLKTYGEIIGVPVDVVFTREELAEAITRHADKDLILIDTAGSSPRNDKQVQELVNLLAELPELEKHLVISATTKPQDVREIVARFIPGQEPCKLIITKVDESNTLGIIVNIMLNSPVILSYIAKGQSVPDDIELADPEKLAALILREDNDE